MLVMVVFFIAFRWIHLSTQLSRLFLLVLILLLMPTLNFLPVCFFFQPEDGIRAFHVTGVQTCALPISGIGPRHRAGCRAFAPVACAGMTFYEIGRASCRERVMNLSAAIIRLYMLVLILLLMPPLNFLPVWFALSLLRVRLPSRLPMLFS